MSKTQDAFPSRLKESAERINPFIRIDPVVHSRNEFRWQGPLDEVALSRYERDGFVHLPGLFGPMELEPVSARKWGEVGWGGGRRR